MVKNVFIINPTAGKKKGVHLIPHINKIYNKPNENIILQTEYKGHATEIAKKYSGNDVTIYSIGGDGTLNEVLNGMAKTESTLAVVPCGSGNDFIKSITTIKDPVELLKKYKTKKLKQVDVAIINNRYFLNISSIGFDAEIVYNAKSFKKIPLISGELSYLLSIFRTIFNLKAHDVNITIDKTKHLSCNIILLALANGKYYGGGMMPVPKATLDNGFLDICLVNNVSKLKTLRLLPKYIKGVHGSINEVEFYRCKEMIIESNTPLPFNMDGEVSLVKSISATIVPKGVKIITP